MAEFAPSTFRFLSSVHDLRRSRLNILGLPTPPVAPTGPVVTLASPAGTVPVNLFVSDGVVQQYAGEYIQWQFSQPFSPAAAAPKNADGSYVNVAQENVTFLSGQAFGDLKELLGYNDPSGQYAFHLAFCQDNPNGTGINVSTSQGDTFNVDRQGWSPDLVDTITVSVAQWSNGALDLNAGKITLSGSPTLNAKVTAGNNTFAGTRASIPAQSTLVQAEQTISSLIATGTSSNGDVYFGVCDSGSVQDLSSSTVVPGSTLPGCGMRVRYDSATYTIHRNGGTQSGTLPGATPAAVGDAIIWRLDTSGVHPVMEYWYYRSAGATITAIATVAGSNAITLLSQVPAAFYACFGGWKTNDGGLANFGASAFIKALDNGFNFYG